MEEELITIEVTAKQADLIRALNNIRHLYGKNWENQRVLIDMYVDELTEPFSLD